VTASRYSATTVDHFQHPRNVGRMADADRTGHVDDPATETTVTLYVKLEAGIVGRASFRTFGCSACIAASSIATELLVGRSAPVTADQIDRALGGLPDDKRYCAELVARATRHALAD
jgi:NifU-like protein involved in Fe-S cluster formation